MFQNLYKPEKGCFLVSEPFMHDANFKRAVVFLTEHDEEGTVGYVLNRKTNLTINDLIEGLPHFESPIFIGGPVEKNTLHYIHSLGDQIYGSKKVCENVYWGGDFEELKRLILLGLIDPKSVLFFIGYSGWSSGQLQEEIKQKSWIVAPNHDSSFIFDETDTSLWRKILKEMGGEYQTIANYPQDPRTN